MISNDSILCNADGARLDQFLAESLSMSRSRIVQLIDQDLVFVNGKNVNKNYRLSQGDTIEYSLPPDEEIEALPQNIPIDIVYEDGDIIVLNKPQGMVVHPAPGTPDGTLVNALLYHCKSSLSGINGKLRPGIVHRIDKDTSGLLIVAKNDEAHSALSEMFSTHSFRREYEAILCSCPQHDEGTVNLAIGRSRKDRKKMAAFPPNTPNTKNAITHYRVLERFSRNSHVRLQLETGRTHQIRVHMLSLSCPVLGDPVYSSGRANLGLSGQCLHAALIAFHHPRTGEWMEFSSPLPSYFTDTLEKLRKNHV